MSVLLNGITCLLRQVRCAPVIHRLPLYLVAPAPVALSPWHAPSDTTIKWPASGGRGVCGDRQTCPALTISCNLEPISKLPE